MASFQTHLKKNLDGLECHFTWNLSDSKRSSGLVLERLERSRDRGECTWEGLLYNLLGYYYQLKDSTEEALKCLQKAEVILRDQEAEGRGPWLLVNQANLAWVHYHMGELPESEAYLQKVAQLQKDFPAPPGCDLHPEVYGEKGWTQLKLDMEVKKEAIANFEKALRGDPNRKEWHAGLALAKYKVYSGAEDESLNEEIIEQIKRAKTIDPDNLRMSTLYLVALGNAGRQTKENVREAYDLVQQIKPGNACFGEIFHFLRFFDSSDDSADKVLKLAEDFLSKYPSEWDAKKQVALCYKRKIFKCGGEVDHQLIKKAIDLFEEIYPPSDFRAQTDLAGLYVRSGNTAKAGQIYRNLFSQKNLEPQYLQLLYVRYAKYLHFNMDLPSESIDYHKKAVEIELDSRERNDSIKVLKRIASNCRHSRSTEIRDFLSNLQSI